jgi:hypothetical protein
MFELWDLFAGRSLGRYDSFDDACAAVRAVCDERGAPDMSIAGPDGRPVVDGAALLDRAGVAGGPWDQVTMLYATLAAMSARIDEIGRRGATADEAEALERDATELRALVDLRLMLSA